ncbi:hypothetical protein LOD99_9216 [Oopsacas minuta]|uniref:Uncharacterized protein n=1 Tax=Oopsacas minuta TaxID=111878 RepID=A0AAV7JDE8_9METZ|nr:hypothetical protein LOD99_9216 [Oopsacas minuta]
MSLEEDTNIPSEEKVAKISSILEREDRAQSSTLFIKSSDIRLRKQFSSEEKREECQNVIITDMEQHHYIRTLRGRGFEKHDVTCGCDKSHSSCSSSEVEV